MKRKLLIGIVVLFIVAAIATPTTLLIRTNASQNKISAEAQAVLDSFGKQYGVDKQVVRVSTPSKLYMVYWVAGNIMHVSLLADGVWVEIANAPVIQPSTSTTP